ncbi:MAG: LuxR C-terminal-related transcriptional regulator [candidate division Zixibacteria bacterium]
MGAKLKYRKIDNSKVNDVSQGITEYTLPEEQLIKKTHDLDERIKELNCLYDFLKLSTDRNLTIDEVLQETVNLIPPSWQYPEITCARLTINDREYKTENFEETRWKQSAPIIVFDKPAGELAVFYAEEMPEMDEGPFLKEERNLINELTAAISRFIELKQSNELIRETNKRLHHEQETVRAKNNALEEILDQIEGKKRKIAIEIQSNIDRIAVPLLDILKERIASGDHHYISLIKNCLSDITSPFVDELQRKYAKLTPREIEICNMTKNGFSSKSIASAFNTSVHTVYNQKKNIRKKLGLSRQGINLAVYLKNLK